MQFILYLPFSLPFRVWVLLWWPATCGNQLASEGGCGGRLPWSGLRVWKLLASPPEVLISPYPHGDTHLTCPWGAYQSLPATLLQSLLGCRGFTILDIFKYPFSPCSSVRICCPSSPSQQAALPHGWLEQRQKCHLYVRHDFSCIQPVIPSQSSCCDVHYYFYQPINLVQGRGYYTNTELQLLRSRYARPRVT